MSQSVQSQVLGAVVAFLAAAGAGFATPVKAWRTRVEAFPPQQLPAWNVLPDDGETEYLECAAVDRRFRFCIRNMVAAQNEADLAADTLYVAAGQALGADPTLGGLVRYTREKSQKWERDGPGAQDALALVVTYEVEFATLRTDPTTPVP